MYLLSRTILLVLASVIMLLSSCASTTLIESYPSRATVYIDNQKKGTTPYNHSDTKISGSAINVTLKKEGYEDFKTTIIRNERPDVGAIVGGFFVLIPFLWTMQYDSNHKYELDPLEISNEENIDINENSAESNSTNELVKLKNLLDQKIISTEDFTTLKVNILNNNYDYSNSIADQIMRLNDLLKSNLLTDHEFFSQKNKLVNI